jgi:hypothetical protein
MVSVPFFGDYQLSSDGCTSKGLSLDPRLDQGNLLCSVGSRYNIFDVVCCVFERRSFDDGRGWFLLLLALR